MTLRVVSIVRVVHCLTAAVPFVLLLLSGCTGVRHVTAGWLGLEPVPARVAGLAYSGIAELGALTGACATLDRHHRLGDYVSASRLHRQWLPACRAQIERARDARLDALVAAAYQAQQAAEARRQRRHQQRLERQRRRAQRAAAIRAKEVQEAKQAQRAAQRSRARQARMRLRQRLADARIRQVLRQVPDQPLAYVVGQPSGRSMKDFLACLEVGYPNRGYSVRSSEGSLLVTARGADISRDHVDIRVRFVNVWDTWVLKTLSVAGIRAVTPRERFQLARNLLGGSPC